MSAILTGITRFARRLGSQPLLALFFALTFATGIYLGRHWADLRGANEETIARMQSEFSAMDAELKAVRGDLEMQRTRHEVDKHALELLRSEIAAEKIRTAELEEGLSFYRSMVVSDETSKGLSLRKPELVPGDNPGRVRYRFFVQQKDREYEMVEGRLSVEVFGMNDDREVTYPLAKLSKEFDDKAATLQFRYFQSIEGEITLPDGFEPKGINLAAHARKPREMEVREQYPWTVQERFINVGE
jgi:hypothetical protein